MLTDFLYYFKLGKNLKGNNKKNKNKEEFEEVQEVQDKKTKREKIEIENMYEKYCLRSELLKSKKFYQNAFDTAVNYDALMDLKKELM